MKFYHDTFGCWTFLHLIFDGTWKVILTICYVSIQYIHFMLKMHVWFWKWPCVSLLECNGKDWWRTWHEKNNFYMFNIHFFPLFIYLPNIKLCVTILALHLNNLSFALLCIISDNELSINEGNKLILWKLSSIWMIILDYITYNLNEIGFTFNKFEFKFHWIQNFNSIEKKWDANSWKIYWKFTHDYGGEKNKIKKT